MRNMTAYLVNEYYIFTNYKELSSHVHDIIHHTVPSEKEDYLFFIIKGTLDLKRLLFISEHGEQIPIYYEAAEDICYCAKTEVS